MLSLKFFGIISGLPNSINEIGYCIQNFMQYSGLCAVFSSSLLFLVDYALHAVPDEYVSHIYI